MLTQTNNKNKFTKIRKWAKEKGYEVIERRGYGGAPQIKIVINDKLYFEAEMKESSITHTIRGKQGYCAGLYITTFETGYNRHYAWHQRTQVDAIKYMERDIERQD